MSIRNLKHKRTKFGQATTGRLLAVAAMLCLTAKGASAQADHKTLFFISNSHLDSQWNWDVRTTIGEYVRKTMTQNFPLLDKYPNFNFNFEGAIRYRWMKEYWPSDYAKLKKYIASGRWHVSGCCVDANDVMTTSAESIMRNWLYGTTFFQKEFGVRGGHDIMLPDCFGFSYALPSLARHCGMTGFHTAKLAWGSSDYGQLPDWGLWQGVDGSQIYAVYKPGAYDTHEDYNHDLATDASLLSEINNNYKNYGTAVEIRYVGPRSDRGGGLQDNTSSSGENTPYWLNYSASKTTGQIDVCLASPDSIFSYLNTYRNQKYSVWNNELPMLTHGVGAYTSRGMLKRWNRRTELLADAAEKASSLATWLGTETYPQEAISESWMRMLWQQHHDGITGTSIPRAYTFSENEYVLANKTLANVLTQSVGSAARMLDTQVEGTPVIVYNPLSFVRTDIVEASIHADSRPSPLAVSVFAPDGKEVLAQVTGYDEAAQRLKFIFAATVPSLGMAVYDVRIGTPSSLTGSLSQNASTLTLGNGAYSVTLNKSTGNVQSLTRTSDGRQLVSTCSQQMLHDNSTTWPSWEIKYSDVAAQPYATVDDVVSITASESGPLRSSFRVERQKEGSRFVQYVSMNALNNRVDFKNEVDWQTRATMLKAAFNFMFGNDKATYDISLGTIQRGNRSEGLYEVQGHQWADVSTPKGTYGVSVLNDSKYGWDKPNNTQLRLTLIHTPGVDNNYTYQSLQDLGVNQFTYSLFPHEGNWGTATQKAASELNQPLTGFVTDKHAGTLGRTVSFVSASTDCVSIKALKKAENSDETIVRVYEWAGADLKDVSLTFPTDIVSAREVNGLEEPVGDVAWSGNRLTFDIGHYQPRTFAVRFAAPSAAAPDKVNNVAVDLDYDADVMSYNNKRTDATGSLVSLAYPAELVPDMVSDGNVTFRMGDRTAGHCNAVRCKGQTVRLSRAAGQNKLYVLMMSTKQGGADATFKAGDAAYTFHVPYYTGYVGQLGSPFSAGTRYVRDDVSFAATHAHNCQNGTDKDYTYLYMYRYVIPLTDDVESVTLPASDDVCLLAATLSDNRADDVQPATAINTYIDYDELAPDDEKDCGKLLAPVSIKCSAQNGTAERAALAADMDETTKWCVTPGQDESPWIEYDFNEPVEVCRWMVLNAGCESTNDISSDFALQAYINGSWQNVDNVSGNTDNYVSRGVTAFRASRIRLHVIKGQQDDNHTTRIYEFAVYGHDSSTPSGINRISAYSGKGGIRLFGCHPNPCSGSTTVEFKAPEGLQGAWLEMFDNAGRKVNHQRIPLSGLKTDGGVTSFTCPINQSDGVYLYRIVPEGKGSMPSETKRMIVVSK